MKQKDHSEFYSIEIIIIIIVATSTFFLLLNLNNVFFNVFVVCDVNNYVNFPAIIIY